jgi:hypothetical protein
MVNVGTDQVCKTCALEFNPVSPAFASPPAFFPYDQQHTGWQNNGTSAQLIGPFDGVGSVLGPTLKLFTKNFWLITKIVFVIVAPLEIFKALSISDLNDGTQMLGILGLSLLCKILIAPALIYGLMRVMETGNSPGVNECYRWGLSRVGKLLACATVAGVLELLGFSLCIVPGIIISLALSLVYPIAVLENGSISQVLRKSKQLTQSHLWEILAASIVMWLFLGAISLPAWFVAAQFGWLAVEFWPIRLAATICYDILQESTTVLSLVIYISIQRPSPSLSILASSALWHQQTQ